MAWIDSYPLKNASVRFKLAATLGLLGSASLLGWNWFIALTVVDWNREGIARMSGLGDELFGLAWSQTGNFLVLFALQVVAYAGLWLTTRSLFQRTSLRRRMKAFVTGIATLLVGLNVLLWLSIPFLSLSRSLAGPLGLASSVVLIAMALPPLWQMWIYTRWSHAKPTRVVVVGGGFAGLYAALGLDSALGYHPKLDLILIDQKNFFLFPPLLPSASVGTVETRQVTTSFRRIIEPTNIHFRQATVVGLDPARKQLKLQIPLAGPDGQDEALAYDYVVLAPGSTTQTFGTPGVEQHALFVRQLSDAMAIRSRIIDCFERAAVLGSDPKTMGSDPSRSIVRELLRFVVIGGGPTGIETATEIYDLIHEVLLKRYPEIHSSWPEVVVVQSGNQILPGWSEKVVRLTTEQLKRLGVRTVLGNRVTAVTPTEVQMKEGPAIATRTAIWCAGVKPSPLLAACGLPLDKSGRVLVRADLGVDGYDGIFVLGDSATCMGADGKPLPPLGQVAFQQGAHMARNLIRLLRGEPARPFKYFNFGSLVSVGEHYAAVDLLGVTLSGFIGWFVWRTLYLAKMVGFSNKVRIVIDWTLDLLIERSIAQLQQPEEMDDEAKKPQPQMVM